VTGRAARHAPQSSSGKPDDDDQPSADIREEGEIPTVQGGAKSASPEGDVVSQAPRKAEPFQRADAPGAGRAMPRAE
jgi:hypothetical protein